MNETDFRSSLTTRPPGLAEIIAAMPVAMLVLTPDNRVAEVNPRGEILLNMARSAIVGSEITRIVRIDQINPTFDLWLSDKPLAVYDILLHAGRTVSLKADLMIAPIGEYEGWRILTIHTQSLAQKIGGRRASGGTRSAMGAAAILAHEIKNPLSGIRGAAQLLESSAGGEGVPLTQLICNEVDRIAALIDRMQDFTTERKLDCQPTNIYPVLDQAIQIASTGFASGVKLVRHYDPSLPHALCHADTLAQVIINLLKNASEALAATPGPQIRIETAFRHGVSVMLDEGKGNAVLPIEIAVIDNGPGVPPAIQDDLFNPFISGKAGGQGLGLALVDKLVRDMNGFVEYVRDKDMGESIFRIMLPMGSRE